MNSCSNPAPQPGENEHLTEREEQAGGTRSHGPSPVGPAAPAGEETTTSPRCCSDSEGQQSDRVPPPSEWLEEAREGSLPQRSGSAIDEGYPPLAVAFGLSA